jgi:hypothetical protein
MKQAILGTALILMTVTGFIIWSALVEQEKAYNHYINEDHKYFCELAESREASNEYLISNNCK